MQKYQADKRMSFDYIWNRKVDRFGVGALGGALSNIGAFLIQNGGVKRILDDF